MISKALYSSNSDEWYTPQDLFNKWDAEFHFNLDPCATESSHKCDLYYTKIQDGLSKNWGGVRESFVIPPIAKLVNGLRRHIENRGKITL